MEKRTAGEPLSEAELQQRRDAARARWADVATGAAGGASAAVAGSLARTLVERQTGRRKAGKAIRDGAAAAAAEPARAEARIARYGEAVQSIKSRIGGPFPMKDWAQHLRRQRRQLDADWDDFASGRRVPPDHLIGGNYSDVARSYGQRSFDLSQEIMRAETRPKPGRRHFLEGKPAVGRVKGGGRRKKIPGITAADIPPIRAEMRGDLKARAEHFGLTERAKVQFRQRDDRAASIGEARDILRARPKLSGRGLAAAGVLGAALGGLGALLGSRPVEKLAKAAPRGTGAATNALAARLAGLFRAWAENPAQASDVDDTRDAIQDAEQSFREAAEAVARPPQGSDTQAAPSGGDPRAVLAFNFDSRNPRVERELAAYSFDLIRSITDQSREAIRTALQLGALSGAGIPEQARLVRQSVGLSPGQVVWVQSFRKQLERLDPKALDRELRDRRFDPTIRKAIEAGRPMTDVQIQSYVDAYQRRTLAYRATMIAQTETLRATNRGSVAQVKAMLEADPSLTVEKTWRSAGDDRVRDAHKELEGQMQVGLDTPFVVQGPNGQTRSIRYPHDPMAAADLTVGCRCSMEFRVVPMARARRELVAEAV